MPRVAQYQAVQFKGFDSGLNKQVDSSRLELNELPEALNIRLGKRGEVILRSGYSRYDSTLTTDSSFIFPWREFGGDDHLIVVDLAGAVWKDDLDGVFANSGFNVGAINTLASFGVGMASADKKAYISSKKIPNVTAYVGFAWTAVAAIPKGKALHHRHDRLFSIGTDANPSRLFFSDFLDPEVFQPASFIDFDPDDGFEINASTVFGDDLILFKDNAIWKLSGRTPASFATYRIDNLRGCVAPRGIAQLRGQLMFMDRDTGIWAFDGASLELISQPINDYILANQNYDLGWQASMYAGDDRLYVSIPWFDGSRHSFVYFADTGAWSEYDTGFAGSAFYLKERYLGLVGAAGVYQADPLSTVVPPSGTPLEAKFRTPWVRVGGPGIKARIRRVEMLIRASVSVTVTLNMYRDYDEETVYIARTFQGGPIPYAATSFDERVIALDGFGDRLHAIQFEFVTSDAPFALNEMAIFYTGGLDVRGER